MHLREFDCLVCWCDVDKACLQLQVDLGNSDDGLLQVLGDSRLILLVRIRGFSLPVHRNKEYEAMRLIRVTSVLRKIRNA